MRRCGKTYLLFNLFKDYLLSEGIEILALLSGHRIWCSSFGIMCRAKSRTGWLRSDGKTEYNSSWERPCHVGALFFWKEDVIYDKQMQEYRTNIRIMSRSFRTPMAQILIPTWPPIRWNSHPSEINQWNLFCWWAVACLAYPKCWMIAARKARTVSVITFIFARYYYKYSLNYCWQ